MNFSENEIAEHLKIYASFHEVDESAVVVSRNYLGDDVIGFRLSLDADDSQRGADETYGEWR
jgi:hypothetical protein